MTAIKTNATACVNMIYSSKASRSTVWAESTERLRSILGSDSENGTYLLALTALMMNTAR